MARYEYKVVPAPAKGQKVKGVKTPEGRFALSVEAVLNEMGAEGWDYLRAELLPSEERSGLTGSTTNWRNVLVFRREAESETEAFQPRLLDTPGSVAPANVPAPDVIAEDAWPDDTAADTTDSLTAEPEESVAEQVAEPEMTEASEQERHVRASLRALRSPD